MHLCQLFDTNDKRLKKLKALNKKEFVFKTMARSNLNISSFLSEAFLSAQQPSDESRCIKVLIEGESLTLASVINRQRDVGSDFDELALPALNQHEASILLFSLADGHKDNQKWLLVSYIPDGCKVRDKMLYSSSREDLKRALGLSFFTAEYSANSLDEVRWDLVKAYLSNDRCNEIFLSEAERIVQDEKVRGHNAPFRYISQLSIN